VAQAQADTEQARLAARHSEARAQSAESDKTEMRARLMSQLNLILETRDTARGLIVNMSDVLFDTGKFMLKPETREKLAKVAGVLIAYPGLNTEVDGHTDNVGGDDFNQTLSDQRATSVRDYLVKSGVGADFVLAKGFGKTQPVDSDDTAAGRQMNRRVELVVSGDSIVGALISPTPAAALNK
jgi:outer membrane protein OmpA-like peptidoglycan-associated protein